MLHSTFRPDLRSLKPSGSRDRRVRTHARGRRPARPGPLIERLEGRIVLATVPVLNSLPGAAAEIYLDFNGDRLSSFGSWSNITIPVFDTDGDPTTLTDA